MLNHRIQLRISTVLCAVSALATGVLAQHEVKVPRPLPNQVDPKLQFQPAPLVQPTPQREVPPNTAPPVHMPPKTDAPASEGKAPAIDFSTMRFDEPGDGALWARGRTYKARFDASSATYIPFLGSQAPKNFPVKSTLTSVSVDSAEFELATNAYQHEGSDVVIDHGSVREVWHLGVDAAEQTFVFDSLPTRGDLRVRLALDTELTAHQTAHGLELSCEQGSVVIGHATAIDALGRRLALESSFDNGSLVIDVPRSFTASAVFPLTIDPVFSTNALDTSASATALPDISNGNTSGYWAAVYQFTYSATDADVWTQDVYFGIPQAGGVWVDFTSNSWIAPRVAHNALHNTFLTTAQVRPTPNAASEIWVRARTGGTVNQFNQQQVQSSILGSCFYADVGGDPALAAPTYFLVAWTRNFAPTDWDIHARLIDWDGTPLGSNIFLDSTSAFDWFPSVSKTDGRPPYSSQEWNVAWMRTTGTDTDIRGAQVHWDGTITTPSFPIETNSLNDTYPSASSLLDGSSGPRPWMCTFTRAFSDTDIIADVLIGASVQASRSISVLEGVNIFANQSYSDVDSNGQRFAIAYSEDYTATDRDLYVACARWSNGDISVDEAHQQVDYSIYDTIGAQIACGLTESNFGMGYYGLAWQQFNTGHEDVFVGAYYEPANIVNICPGDGTAGTCPCGNNGASGRGCANSVTTGAGLFPQGNAWVSGDTFSLFAFGLPTSTTCLYFQGTNSSNASAFGDGLRCISGSVTRIGTKTAVGGVATYPEAGDVPISVRGLVPTDGGWRGYQVWYRNAASFCTPSTFNMSSGVSAIWLR